MAAVSASTILLLTGLMLQLPGSTWVTADPGATLIVEATGVATATAMIITGTGIETGTVTVIVLLAATTGAVVMETRIGVTEGAPVAIRLTVEEKVTLAALLG